MFGHFVELVTSFAALYPIWGTAGVIAGVGAVVAKTHRVNFEIKSKDYSEETKRGVKVAVIDGEFLVRSKR